MSTTLTAVTDAARHADDAATSVAALAALARRLGLTYAPTSARWLAEVNRAMVEAERAEEAARAARFALRRIADCSCPECPPVPGRIRRRRAAS